MNLSSVMRQRTIWRWHSWWVQSAGALGACDDASDGPTLGALTSLMHIALECHYIICLEISPSCTHVASTPGSLQVQYRPGGHVLTHPARLPTLGRHQLPQRSSTNLIPTASAASCTQFTTRFARRLAVTPVPDTAAARGLVQTSCGWRARTPCARRSSGEGSSPRRTWPSKWSRTSTDTASASASRWATLC